jgi:hypothetical protein
MALSPPEGPSQPPSEQPAAQRDLPAAYRNPWSTLGENLEAVAADARLRLQALARRNSEGSLWRPSWWPADVAPLFWPLLLALALALLLGLGVQGAAALRRFNTPVNATSSPGALEAEAPPSEPAPSQHPPEPAGSDPEPAVAEAPAPPPAELPLTSSEDASLESELEPEPDAEPAPLNPLAALVQRPEADGLLISARPSADQRTLVLQLAAGFAALPVADRQRYAEQWQLWAADLGYDHLELRDSRAGLLARDALVGAGMIVLNESSSP